MPKYTKSNIKIIIRFDDFKKLFYIAPNMEQKTWITLLWLTGGRPEEILELEKKDITIHPEHITVSISTKKQFKTTHFILQKRNLFIRIPSVEPWIETLQRHINRLNRELLFSFSIRTGYNIVSKLGEKALRLNICPYNFRHSRMTLLAEQGATMDELKRFKGSSTDTSVKPYIHAKAIEYTVETTIKPN